MSRYFVQEVYGKRFSGVNPVVITEHPFRCGQWQFHYYFHIPFMSQVKTGATDHSLLNLYDDTDHSIVLDSSNHDKTDHSFFLDTKEITGDHVSFSQSSDQHPRKVVLLPDRQYANIAYLWARGGYSSMIWVGTCCWDLKSRPIFIPNFAGKWYPFLYQSHKF